MENSELLKPEDIQNQKFSQSLRGYNVGEVDEFLEKVYRDYQRLLTEKKKMGEKINFLHGEVTSYKEKEESIKKALILAQESAEKLLKEKTREAEEILEKAKKTAEEITRKNQKAIEEERKHPQKEGRSECNPVNRLQEFAQEKDLPLPKYSDGEFNGTTYKVVCHFNFNGQKIYSYGVSRRKKEARKKAASFMLQKLGYF